LAAVAVAVVAGAVVAFPSEGGYCLMLVLLVLLHLLRDIQQQASRTWSFDVSSVGWLVWRVDE
jgi:hypothetical protein